MKHLERRLLAAEDGLVKKARAGAPPLYVQHLCLEDLRPVGASEVEHLRYLAVLERVNAHADALVRDHGDGILRPHACRNDALSVLTDEDLEFVEHMITTYRFGGETLTAA